MSVAYSANTPPASGIRRAAASVKDIGAPAIDRYWRTVSDILADVFHVPNAASVAQAVRERLETEASPDTQLLFYHASPADVAADLAGRPATNAEIAAAAQHAGIGATV